ncbi:LOW QUALITY PROTEIN: peripheral-type benzodiazepine receptor-associated protein 1 [Pelodytes ibericus]
MLKETVNISRFSPKKSDNIPLEELKKELDHVKRELKNEKFRSHESRKKYNSELKRYKDSSEKEKNKLVDDLKSKWEQQKTRELQQLKESVLRERELEIRQLLRWKEEELRELKTSLQKERNVAVQQARELQKQLVEELLNKGYGGKANSSKQNNDPNSRTSVVCQCKIQDILAKLRWDYDGEQAARIRHLKVELDVERNLFIKYILESSRSNYSVILNGNSKSLDCGQIKFGRYSLGNIASRPRSSEVLSQPQSLESGEPIFWYEETAVSHSKLVPLPQTSSPQGLLERQPWLESPADDEFLGRYDLSYQDNPMFETNISHSVTRDKIITLEILENKVHPICPKTEDQKNYDSENTTENKSNDCNPSQSYSTPEKNIDNSQLWSNGSDLSQSKQDVDLLNTVQVLEQRCNDLKAENILLRKNIFPETEEKVKRLKRKNAELAVIAKRLEERAHKLQEANLKMVNTPMHLKGTNLEACKKVFARQRSRDISEQASALLAKDKQIETLKLECRELHAKLAAEKDFPTWLKLSDLDRLLRESQKEVLRLQRQIAIKHLNESLHLSRSDSSSSLPHPLPPDAVYIETSSHSNQAVDCDDKSVKTNSGDITKEYELTKKRKECEFLEQEVKKKQKRCEELEIKLHEVQTENARLVEENSRLSNKVKWTTKVESENADLRGYLDVVTEQRDSALKESHQLQSKLENLEQVLKHMRDVVERRQQLEKDHEDALISLQKRQEEVKRLQEAQVEAKKEHEGAVQLLENTLDNLQANVKILEEKCRSQTEQFGLLSQELERFRLQAGNIDLLTSTLVTSELLPPQSCSTPGLPKVQDDSQGDSLPKLDENEGCLNKKVESKKQKTLPQPPDLSCEASNVEAQNNVFAKEKQKLEAPHTSSKSESTHESRKSCPTPEVDTASEMEELESDSVSLNPEPEPQPAAKLEVFLARYSYNPFDGPNENPEAELPLTAGEYIYIYGDMDDDGFYEGELMDGRRGLVPSNFVERVSDDGLMAFQPAETNELSHNSGQDVSFLSGSSIEKSEEDDDESSLSPLPCSSQGNSEGSADISAVPYPRKLTLIKQLARSVVVGWEPPLVTAGSAHILSYNIYVDNELRQNVRCGGQTKALIEKLELKTQTYRISVQSMTERGCSDKMRCSLLVGHGFSIAPTQLRVRSLSATSAEITWQPCNSNYSHALYLNEEACGVAKAGIYWYSFCSLRPSTMYNVKVEARPQRIPWELPLERREQKTTVMQLTTPSAGPPDAPLDVQVEIGPTPGVLLISWLPVTIDAAGTSNGVRVVGYAVYADGQKVLEVTSPTAGSVLVGMSHLQLLQVSREISVRTMSPSGESVDSVPAQIPSALLKVPDWSSSLNTLSNSSLICDPASGQPLASSSETFPSMPLISSSPCSLSTPPTTSPKANISINTSCSRGEAIDSLPVRLSPHYLLSPHGASSGRCQDSSSSNPSEAQEKVISILPQTESNSVTPNLSCSSWASENVEQSNIVFEERRNRLQNKSLVKTVDTKEAELNNQLLPSGLPTGLESGKSWNSESPTELRIGTAKEDCSSPETVFSEEAEDTSCSVGYRGVSIEDFLEKEGEQIKEPHGTKFTEVEEGQASLPDAHATISHMDLSCNSTLSDIMEEEEEEQENDPNAIAFVRKWGQTRESPGTDSSAKLDSCETDSDEEILERMLDLPLQKHCSKKLFSIPEVTEEEDDEEESFTPPPTSKTQISCVVERQKYQIKRSTARKPVNESCESLPSATCRKENFVNRHQDQCFEDDCVLLDQDWSPKTKNSVCQLPSDVLKTPVSVSLLLNTKKNSYINDRGHNYSESNRKRLSDTREHCSRLATNSSQTGLDARGHSPKDQTTYCIPKETPQNNHKSWKTKPRKSSERQSFVGLTQRKTKTPTSCISRSLEIDIEYDTEDEEEPPFPVHYLDQPKTNLWEDSPQADRDGWSDSSSQSEPIQHIRKQNLKRQCKVQSGGAQYAKGNNALFHREMGGSKHNPYPDDPDCRLQSNKTIRTARLECTGKDDWNRENRSLSLVGPPGGPVPLQKKRTMFHLPSSARPEYVTETDHCASSEFCQTSSPQEKGSPVKIKEWSSVRIFVARFDYDPATMSHNPDAYEEELPFKEGQILQVVGDKDVDGFYRGEYAGKTGYIPCNMVSELYIQNEDMKAELVRQGCLKSSSLQNDLEIRAFPTPLLPTPLPLCPPGRLAIPPPKPRRSKKEKSRRSNVPDLSNANPMVARFDYNPRESSPNVDVEAELSFTAGDVIIVYGPMDEDGFYYGELNGQRGLVPSNFLEVCQIEVEKGKSQEPPNLSGERKFRADISIDQPDSSPEDHTCNQVVDSTLSPEVPDMHHCVSSNKKKKSFFSKGRKLFKKLGSSGKNM